MAESNYPEYWEDRARRLRKELEELQEEKWEKRSQGAELSSWKKGRIHECLREAEQAEQIARNMRHGGRRPESDSQSSAANQARRVADEINQASRDIKRGQRY